MVSPNAASTEREKRIASGIEVQTIRVQRQLPRKTRIINAVRSAAVTLIRSLGTIANASYHRAMEEISLMPTRNINLTPEMDQFVDTKIQSGQYANVSEVLLAGLRALEEDDQEN
jgi:hypothetical protein